MNRSLNEGYNGYQLKLIASLNMLVSLYIDPDYPDDFVPGFVRAINNRQVLLSVVSPHGRYDGFLVARIACIQMVLGEDDLAWRLKKLMEIHAETPPEPIDVQPDEDLARAICRRGMERNQVVTLITDNSEFSGFVIGLDDMRATIQTLDYFGRQSDRVAVKLREIEIATIGTEEDRMIEALNRHG